MKYIKDIGLRKTTGGKQRMFAEFICVKCKMVKEGRKDCKQSSDLCRKCVNTTHGEESTKLYAVWLSMKARCNNPKNPRYPNYGGRGIKVCTIWMDSYLSFSTWAKSNGYIETTSRNKITTLERKDNNLNYSPDNCKFITQEEQMLNRQLIQSNNSSGYRGVSKKCDKWQSQVKLPTGKIILSPRFSLPIDAAKWREEMITHYGLTLQRNVF